MIAILIALVKNLIKKGNESWVEAVIVANLNYKPNQLLDSKPDETPNLRTEKNIVYLI